MAVSRPGRRRIAQLRKRPSAVAERLMLSACIMGLVLVWLGYFAFGVGTTGGGKGPVSGSPAGASQLASPLSVPATGHALPLKTTPALPSPAVTPATPTAIPAAPAIAAAPARPAAAEPLRVSYPAAGIDVPVHPLQPTAGEAASQSIVPPETKDGYWLTPFGSPGTGSTNTTYIIGHSWVDQDAPFNHLSTAAAPGGVLTVTTAGGALSYRVDSIATYSKAELKDSPIWEVVPDRLVLISCYTEDPWGRNVVVVASPL